MISLRSGLLKISVVSIFFEPSSTPHNMWLCMSNILPIYSIYFQIWHWKNIRIEFSILDENWEIRQDYLENINTEEKRRLWCEKEAIARLQEVDPAAELIWIEWTENEEVGEQYWMITIISRKFVVRFNKNWYQWEMPDLCQANFTNWELSTMASQAYMIIE